MITEGEMNVNRYRQERSEKHRNPPKYGKIHKIICIIPQKDLKQRMDAVKRSDLTT